jgi:hypothetical protein
VPTCWADRTAGSVNGWLLIRSNGHANEASDGLLTDGGEGCRGAVRKGFRGDSPAFVPGQQGPGESIVPPTRLSTPGRAFVSPNGWHASFIGFSNPASRVYPGIPTPYLRCVLRDLDTIDGELRLVMMLRHAARERGGGRSLRTVENRAISQTRTEIPRPATSSSCAR